MFRLEVKQQIEKVLKKLIPEYDRENAWEIVDIIEREYVGIDKKYQDEINQLKQQHAEEISKLETQIKTGIDLQTILLNTVEIERNTHKGYRQAVKDILGSETEG